MTLLIALLKSNWKLVLIALVASSLFAAGWHTGAGSVRRSWDVRKAEDEAQALRERDEVYADANRKSAQLEAELARLGEVNQDLNRRIDDEIAKDGVYRACRVPTDGVRLANEARATVGDRAAR